MPAVAAVTDSQTTQGTLLNYSGQLPSTGAIADFVERERMLADAAAATSVLLLLLRQVPATFVASPRLWVPRQVRQQVAAALRELVAGAAATADAAPGDVQAEIAHLLCRAGPQLLLRYPPQPADSEPREGAGPDAVNGPGVLLLLRARLLKARNGDWKTLVNDLLDDVAVPPTIDQRAQPSTRDASGSISAATAQAATVKARNGSRRAATDLLIGGPVCLLAQKRIGRSMHCSAASHSPRRSTLRCERSWRALTRCLRASALQSHRSSLASR